LKSAPRTSTIFNSGHHRIYDIFVNPGLYNVSGGPDSNSLTSIITHEMMHIRNYTQWSSVQLVGFGAKYVADYKFHKIYEHATDACVLQRAQTLGGSIGSNLVAGLVGYREWIYGALANKPSELAAKKAEYMTPAQIEDYVNNGNRTFNCECGCF
jgi:hypothetical protein